MPRPSKQIITPPIEKQILIVQFNALVELYNRTGDYKVAGAISEFLKLLNDE